MNNDEKKYKGKALDTRVGRLEGVVTTLSKEVQDITRAVRDITNSLGTFKEDILARLGTATAPKWPLIAGVCSMLLTILGLCGTIVAILLSGHGQAIKHNQESLQAINAQNVEVAFQAGKTEANIRNVDEHIQCMSKRQAAVEDNMHEIQALRAQVDLLIRLHEIQKQRESTNY